MFGYACRETDELMPLPITLAHKICKRLVEVRKADELHYLRPDGKAQVTVRYEVDEHGRQQPVEIERVLVSTQHADGIDVESLIKPDLIERVLHPILPRDMYDEKRLEHKDFVYVNPTGRFVVGGPMGDTGLTGRKIIVDTYGGAARHGGGAFSGKDPTKVDRSAAYAARYVGQERRGGGTGGSLRAAGRLRDRRRAPLLDPGRVLRHGAVPVDVIEQPHRRALRPAPGRHPRATSTCAAPSTRRRPPTATSAATSTTSPGSAPTRPRRCGRPPASRPRRDESDEPHLSSAPSRSTRSRRRSASASACSAESATHFSLAASFFTDVSVVGVVGDDFGDEELRRLRGPRHRRHRHRARLGRPHVLLERPLRLRPQHGANARHAAQRVRRLRAEALRRREAGLHALPRQHPARPSAGGADAMLRGKLVALDSMNYWIDSARDVAPHRDRRRSTASS